jgi:hypothetical protein
MSKMNITNAHYVAIEEKIINITATIDGETMSVPLDPENRHYAEIMRQVEAGELTIEEASANN